MCRDGEESVEASVVDAELILPVETDGRINFVGLGEMSRGGDEVIDSTSISSKCDASPQDACESDFVLSERMRSIACSCTNKLLSPSVGYC